MVACHITLLDTLDYGPEGLGSCMLSSARCPWSYSEQENMEIEVLSIDELGRKLYG